MKDGHKNLRRIEKSLDEIRRLLQHSLAIQLCCSGATQDEISKNLKITKSTINEMVKGINKEKRKSTHDKE